MKKIIITTILAISSMVCFAQKQVYIPQLWSTDPALGKWSYKHSYQTANFALFWGPKAGDNPLSNPPGTSLHFDPKFITDTLEYIFNKYINQYHILSNAPNTVFGKYKTIIVMTNTWDTGGPIDYAVGSQYDNTVAAIFVDASATLDGGVTSHEFTHSIQDMYSIEFNTTPGAAFANDYGSFFFETHANFMRNHLYPGAAGYDMPRWLGTQNFQWGSTRHHYDAFDLPFYIEQVDSLNMISNLWLKSKVNETPLMTYKRLKGWSQTQLNNFMYDYAKRQAAYDYPLYGIGAAQRNQIAQFKATDPELLWRQYVILDSIGKPTTGGRFIVPTASAPQDYGFNVIPLYPTCSTKIVTIHFKGHTEANSVTGWRYGFVTTKSDGTISRYGATYSDNEKQISYTMQNGDVNLYLVVTGAPRQNVLYKVEPGWPKTYRHPYELNIANALPEGYQANFRSALKVNGHKHPNGGGWVANSSTVATTVKVGPKAVVLGNSNITGNVVISGTSYVQDATISGHVQILGNSNITGGTLSQNAIVKENAILNGCTVTGSAVFQTNTLEFDGNYGGNIVLGGDAEIGPCTVGVYYQTPNYTNGRSDCDGKGASDTSNTDINKTITQFSATQMAFTGNVSCGGSPIQSLAEMDEPTVQPDSANGFSASLYPNPAGNTINIKFVNNHKQADCKFTIYNRAGTGKIKFTQTVPIGNSIITIPVNGLNERFYFLNITGADRPITIKFLKN